MSDKIILVCSQKSIYSKLAELDLYQLQKIPIALREVGSGTLATVKKSLMKHNIKLSNLNMKARLGGTEALKNFLLAGNLVGFLPRKSVKKELKSGSMVQLDIQNFVVTRNFYFIQRHGEENRSLNKMFLKYARPK